MSCDPKNTEQENATDEGAVRDYYHEYLRVGHSLTGVVVHDEERSATGDIPCAAAYTAVPMISTY